MSWALFPLPWQYWAGLPVEKRWKLLCVDKPTLFEQVRRNQYCSRCHGLLVGAFTQCVQQSSAEGWNGDVEEDPGLHPWGGLASKDSALTLMPCFITGTPLKVGDRWHRTGGTRQVARDRWHVGSGVVVW